MLAAHACISLGSLAVLHLIIFILLLHCMKAFSYIFKFKFIVQYLYLHILFARQAKFLCLPAFYCEIVVLLLPLPFSNYVSGQFLPV